MAKSQGQSGAYDPMTLDAETLVEESRRVFNKLKGSIQQRKQQQQFKALSALTDRVEYVARGQQSGGSSTEPIFSGMSGEALSIQARHVWNQLKQTFPSEQRNEAESYVNALTDRIECVTGGWTQ